ncbi:hypothetical protein [Nesterenkonia sp. CF4.4]|uniref:hypothetical protein n=1 Tax=Nesterenkonia sp. CF4.4 TaxID=3373079 RepID=UPI003EE4BCCB
MYTQNKRTTVGTSTGDTLLRSVGNLEDIGVTIPKATREKLSELEERRRDITAKRQESNPESAAQQAAQALADGTGTISDVFNGAAAKTILGAGHGSAVAQIFEKAMAINSRQIHKELAALGDTWVTKILRPEVNKRVAFILKAFNSTMELDPKLNPTQADYLLHHNGVPEAWGDLRALHDSAGHFRAYRVIPSTDRRSDDYEFTGPFPSKRGMMAPTLTWFLWAEQQGMKAGIYTEAEAAAHEEAAA